LAEALEGITYRGDFNAWWPDYDHKPEKCFGFVQRGLADMDFAIAECKHHQVAIQAGGHAGFWPAKLAGHFRTVLTFEPEPMLFECLKRNLEGRDNVAFFNMALAEHEGTVMMRPHQSAGSWRVDAEGTVNVKATTIDAMYRAHHLRHCNAIFLDVEGFEVEVLRGAMQTIAAYKPVLHVEELPRAKDQIRVHMRAIGYHCVRIVGRDAVYVPV
jgi:FkbM family methyltransferase